VADWVLGLEAVLADGSVIRTGGRAAKTSSGYNLGDLVVGSEGTLAVVTEATLSLAGLPDQRRGGRAIFETLEDVAAGWPTPTREATSPTRRGSSSSSTRTTAPRPRSTSVAPSSGRTTRSRSTQSTSPRWTNCGTGLAMAVRDRDPDLSPIVPGDVTVPISALPEEVRPVQRVAAEDDLLVPTVGYPGDGNLHDAVLVDRDDPDHVDRGRRASDAIVGRALDLGGRHRRTLNKRESLRQEHGEATVEAMRAVEYALDPNDTLNSGKMFPQNGGRGPRPPGDRR
jgi:D-lactate dehydrogenase (cytochrome)